MLRSVLWPKTYQLTKMSTSHCHQSAWYQIFHRESPSSRTFVETPREQLRPRYGISEDADPGFNYGDWPTPTIDNSTPAPQKDESTT